LIGGNFTQYGVTNRRRIARLNTNGSLDTSFNPGSGADDIVDRITLQPDGKILIGGWFSGFNGTGRSRIARLNTNGSLDATFNPGIGTNSTVFAITLQANDKILIGGSFTSYNGTTCNHIARLNTNGSLDTSFNLGTGAENTVESISLQENGKIMIGGNFTSYNSTSRTRIARLNMDGSLDTGFDPGIGANGFVNVIVFQPDGKVLICGRFTSYDGSIRGRIARIHAEPVERSALQGTTYTNTTCAPAASRPFTEIRSTDGEYRTISRADGGYTLRVFDTLAHTFQAVAPRYYSAVCADLTHKFTDFDQSLDHDFVIRQDTACVLLEVELASPFHRRCFDNNRYRVTYRNTGTETATNAYVQVRLHPLLTPMSSTRPWRTPQSGQDLLFDVGDLAPGQSGAFTLTYHVSCDALWQQTICSQAHIFPDTSCWKVNPDGTPAEPGAPDRTVWDKSSVAVKGFCRNDSTHFTITNTGEPGGGDMQASSAYRVYVDNGLALSGSFLLAGGQSRTYSYYAPGYCLRLEADQRPGHPGFSRPRETMTCGQLQGIALDFGAAPDDEDHFKASDCQFVIGSYDPNDKLVWPGGISEKQYVKENTLMSYRIRFQNTGNDTAFTVVIRDTLPPYLDLNTLEVGAASHAYTFQTHGRTLIWTFNDILLVDSTTNEPESHGYVNFKIRQDADLPRGTRIQNRAGIYFDFNDPIITNYAWITVGDTTLESPVDLRLQTARTAGTAPQFHVYPNPASGRFTVQATQPGSYTLQVLNAQGQLVQQATFVGTQHTVPTTGLAAGVYAVHLQGPQGSGVQRVVVR
jgi:uncharacterized delta-60 repeat protein/uncharacterized repeat protein (TIGR01451 family)